LGSAGDPREPGAGRAPGGSGWAAGGSASPWRADRSSTSKKDLSSGSSPSRLQDTKGRCEISSFAAAFRSTIHRWSVAKSLNG
jgi:hypothetical protein